MRIGRPERAPPPPRTFGRAAQRVSGRAARLSARSAASPRARNVHPSTPSWAGGRVSLHYPYLVHSTALTARRDDDQFGVTSHPPVCCHPHAPSQDVREARRELMARRTSTAPPGRRRRGPASPRVSHTHGGVGRSPPAQPLASHPSPHRPLSLRFQYAARSLALRAQHSSAARVGPGWNPAGRSAFASASAPPGPSSVCGVGPSHLRPSTGGVRAAAVRTQRVVTSDEGLARPTRHRSAPRAWRLSGGAGRQCSGSRPDDKERYSRISNRVPWRSAMTSVATAPSACASARARTRDPPTLVTFWVARAEGLMLSCRNFAARAPPQRYFLSCTEHPA